VFQKVAFCFQGYPRHLQDISGKSQLEECNQLTKKYHGTIPKAIEKEAPLALTPTNPTQHVSSTTTRKTKSK
jgi:uncharacterized protein VirK/YbjX